MKKYLILTLLLVSTICQSGRIKDLADILGYRKNQLLGYGLVVGLNGTGDKSGQSFTSESFKNMLIQLGINVPSNISVDSKNIAAVIVTSHIKPFAKKGQQIDVTVSSIGSAKSLRGGTLLMTPLKGANGKVYANAQGHLIVGGVGASGKDGSSVTINIPSVGRIPSGATIEKTISSNFIKEKHFVLNLHSPDFTTAKRMSQTINQVFGKGVAKAMDATSVKVLSPKDPSEKVSFISVVENLEMEPAQASAKIIVNSRTGTIVIGQKVKVSAAAVSHGNLVVTISESPYAVTATPGVQINNITANGNSGDNQEQQTDPNQPLNNEQNTDVAQNQTAQDANIAQVESSQILIQQENNKAFIFNKGSSLRQIVRTINAVGASPGDLIAILEALRKVGALHAELIVI